MEIKIFFVLMMSWMGRARILMSPRDSRLSLAEPMPSYFYTNINGYPGTYSFGYDVSDANSGNAQFRTEERYPNGTVVGSYGYVDAFGKPQRYRYVADNRGYRVMRESTNPYTNQIYQSTSSGSTEASVTWTRPKRKKNRDIIRKFEYQPNKYNLPYYYSNV